MRTVVFCAVVLMPALCELPVDAIDTHVLHGREMCRQLIQSREIAELDIEFSLRTVRRIIFSRFSSMCVSAPFMMAACVTPLPLL